MSKEGETNNNERKNSSEGKEATKPLPKKEPEMKVEESSNRKAKYQKDYKIPTQGMGRKRNHSASLLVFNLLICVVATFDPAPFVVWKNSERIITKGTIKYNVAVSVQSPCMQFNTIRRTKRSKPKSRQDLFDHAKDSPPLIMRAMAPRLNPNITTEENKFSTTERPKSTTMSPKMTSTASPILTTTVGSKPMTTEGPRLTSTQPSQPASIPREVLNRCPQLRCPPMNLSSCPKCDPCENKGPPHRLSEDAAAFFTYTPKRKQNSFDNLVQTAHQICDETVTEMIKEPLKKLCRLTQKPRRSKRVVAMATIGVLSIVGVASLAIYNAITNVGQDIEINNLWAATEGLAQENEQIKSALKSLAENQQMIVRRMEELEKKVSDYTQAAPFTILTTSKVMSKLSVIRHDLEMAENDVLKGKLSPRLMKVFNFTLKCNDCPIEHSHNFSCNYDEKSQRLLMDFNVPVIDVDTTISYADSFVISVSNETHTCEKYYSGPKYVVLNNGTICPLEQHLFETDNIILKPDITDCEEQNSTKWQDSKCLTPPKPAKMPPQVKRVYNEFFIYCYGENITLFGTRRDCPDYPFRIPSDISFKIGNRPFDSSVVTEVIHSRENSRINFLLDSQLPFGLKTVVIPQSQSLRAAFHKITSFTFGAFQTRNLIFVGLGCGLLILCCIVGCLWVKKRSYSNSYTVAEPINRGQILALTLRPTSQEDKYNVSHLY